MKSGCASPTLALNFRPTQHFYRIVCCIAAFPPFILAQRSLQGVARRLMIEGGQQWKLLPPLLPNNRQDLNGGLCGCCVLLHSGWTSSCEGRRLNTHTKKRKKKKNPNSDTESFIIIVSVSSLRLGARSVWQDGVESQCV